LTNARLRKPTHGMGVRSFFIEIKSVDFLDTAVTHQENASIGVKPIQLANGSTSAGKSFRLRMCSKM